MTKAELAAALRARLAGLPEDDIQKAIDYYSEAVDDCIEDGMIEDEAVASLGSPDDIAEQIMLDAPLSSLVRARVARPQRRLRAWEIVLIILGAPIWLSLAVAAASVVLAVYLTLWSVIVAFFAVALSFGVCLLGGIAGGVLLLVRGSPLTAVALLGAGLLLGGLGIFVFIGTVALTRLLLRLCAGLWRAVKACFIPKGDKHQ